MTQVTIERLGHLGDGIAAGPVFVLRALPGEVVEGEVEQGRIDAPRIVSPSPNRVRPLCAHYKSCGGCELQHAADTFVADWKVDVVRRALSAHGLSTEMQGIETSAPQSRRRATLSGRRTKKGVTVGFHVPRSDAITEIPNCQLLAPELLACLPALRALTLAGGSRKGELRLSASLSENGIDVSVTGGKALDQALEVELARIAGAHALARLAWNDEVLATIAPPVQRFGRAQVVPPPGAFLQATDAGEAALLASVKEAVGDAGRVADLFAGCGTFSLPLAETAEVHAVESDGAMLAALDRGWRGAQGLKLVTTETRDLFRRPLVGDELSRYDAIVIDPPRAGAEAQVAEIANSKSRRIAFVSCNPVTFARDAQVLVASGFSLDWVRVVDQFRWSPHVELAALLTR